MDEPVGGEATGTRLSAMKDVACRILTENEGTFGLVSVYTFACDLVTVGDFANTNDAADAVQRITSVRGGTRIWDSISSVVKQHHSFFRRSDHIRKNADIRAPFSGCRILCITDGEDQDSRADENTVRAEISANKADLRIIKVCADSDGADQAEESDDTSLVAEDFDDVASMAGEWLASGGRQILRPSVMPLTESCTGEDISATEAAIRVAVPYSGWPRSRGLEEAHIKFRFCEDQKVGVQRPAECQ